MILINRFLIVVDKDHWENLENLYVIQQIQIVVFELVVKEAGNNNNMN
jgi:hypothetical protein